MADKEAFVYHEKIGFPQEIADQLNEGLDLDSLEPTLHALDRSKRSYYLEEEDKKQSNVKIKIPESTTVSKSQCFEVGVNEDGNITKIGFRNPELNVLNTDNEYEEFELCLIVDPQSMEVITLYLNYTDDDHESLDEQDYNKPDEFPG